MTRDFFEARLPGGCGTGGGRDGVGGKPSGEPRRPEGAGAEGPEGVAGVSVAEWFWRCTPEIRRQEFLDTAGVARQLGVSRRTVQYWIQVGKLPAIRIGNTYRVARVSLRELVQE